MLGWKYMASLPVGFIRQSLSLNSLLLSFLLLLKDVFRSRVKGTQPMFILDLVRFCQQGKVLLPKRQGVKVSELVVLGSLILGNSPGLEILCQSILSLIDVGDSLDGHHASRLSQLLNW